MIKKYLFLLFTIGLLSSCTATMYDKNKVNETDVVTIYFNSEGRGNIFPTTINGKHRGFGIIKKVKAPPGKLDIQVIYHIVLVGGLKEGKAPIRFFAEPGGEYEVKAIPSENETSFKLRVTNKSNGEEIKLL